MADVKKVKKIIIKKAAPPLWAEAPIKMDYDTAALNAQYNQGAPYPHIALSNFVTDKNFLVAIRNELAKLELVEKSTDLYKVQQSPDLANIQLDSVEAKKHLKYTMMLREMLYSQKFRDLVSEIAGCGPLNAKPDMAASAYTKTSHLLVHDDVISTRKIAYIIYLTPEASNWTAADGGALELYPKAASSAASSSTPIPDVCPTTRILPLFNQMAFFTVVPGQSFHAVQEVYADKARLSVQGWFHADTPAEASGANKEMSLKALKKEIQQYSSEPMKPISIAGAALPSVSVGGEEEGEEAPAFVPPYTLSDADKHYLAEHGINPTYLQPATIGQLADDFISNKAISLQGLFVEELQDSFAELLMAVDGSQKVGRLFAEGAPADRVGEDQYWTLTGPPHIQRFLKLNMEAAGSKRPRDEKKQKGGADGDEDEEELTEEQQEDPSATAAFNMRRLIRQVFSSDAFARLVNTITSPATGGLGFNGRSCVGRRFRSGLDYTVATVPSDQPRLYAVYTTCLNENELMSPEEAEAKRAADEAAGSDDDEESDEPESVWHTCDCGGFDSIITAQDDANPEVLQLHKHAEDGDDDEDDVINLPCVENSLSIFLCKTNQMHFTKYVDSSAPSSRMDVTTVFGFDGELNL